MENAILITDDNVSLDAIATVSTLNFQREKKDVLHYSTDTHFLSVVYSSAGVDEYDEEELTQIRSKISNPVFFVLDTNSFDLLKRFVSTLPDTFNFLIDNDFGGIIDKKHFERFNSFEELFSYDPVQSI